MAGVRSVSVFISARVQCVLLEEVTCPGWWCRFTGVGCFEARARGGWIRFCVLVWFGFVCFCEGIG